jgi:hypothetical protein
MTQISKGSTEDYDEDYDEDILNLSCLASCIENLIKTSDAKIKAIEELSEIKADIDCAMQMLLAYDKELDEDLKHEFGFQYSDLVADIGEQMEDINRLGINLYIH